MDVVALVQEKAKAELANTQDQINLVQSWLGAVSESLPAHRGFASGACAALDEYKAELADFQRTIEAGELPVACPNWGADALAYDRDTLAMSEPTDDGKIRLSFAGFRGRELNILTDDGGEAAALKEIYVEPILELFKHFQEADKLNQIYLEIWVLLRASRANGISHTLPEEIVQRHIRLLKEYNYMKDIGQQMIGLIAENRGVQIKTLYEGGDHGVTADD